MLQLSISTAALGPAADKGHMGGLGQPGVCCLVAAVGAAGLAGPESCWLDLVCG